MPTCALVLNELRRVPQGVWVCAALISGGLTLWRSLRPAAQTGLVQLVLALGRVLAGMLALGWAAWLLGQVDAEFGLSAVQWHELLQPSQWGLGSQGIALGLVLGIRSRVLRGAVSDALVASTLLALGIARLGCFSGGCEVGSATTASWVVACDPWAATTHASWAFHPFALYSAMLGLGSSAIASLCPSSQRHVALVPWLTGSFLIEFARHDIDVPRIVLGLNLGQLTALLSLALLLTRPARVVGEAPQKPQAPGEPGEPQTRL